MQKLSANIFRDTKRSIIRCLIQRQLLVVSFLFLSVGLIFGAKQGCHVYSSSGVNIADCSSLQMTVNVPNDLDPSIEVMNLSGNKLLNISDKSFERYRNNLIGLDLSNMSHISAENVTYDDRSFLSLRRLEFLDISGSCTTRHNFRLPNNIVILKIHGCNLISYNFSNLFRLEELHASDCNMTDFPLLNKNAPLKYLDLRRNNLAKFRVENIAPFCKLKHVRLEMKDGEGLHQTKAYCQCMAIDTWLTKAGTEHDRLNCTKKEKKTRTSYSCPPTPSETALQLREDCLSKIISSSLEESVHFAWWIVAVIIAAGAIPFAIATFIRRTNFSIFKRRKCQSDEDDETCEECEMCEEEE